MQATQEASACEGATLTAYADTVEAQIKAFEQQAQLVGTTPRVGLGVPLQRLLDIQTETRKMTAPGCLKDFHARVLDMMQQHQDGYQNFAAQGSEALTTSTLSAASQALTDIKRDLKPIRDGTVPANTTPAPTAKP